MIQPRRRRCPSMDSFRLALLLLLLFLQSAGANNHNSEAFVSDDYKAGVMLQPYSILYQGVLPQQDEEQGQPPRDNPLSDIPTFEQVQVLQTFTNTFVQDALREHIPGVIMAKTTIVAPKSDNNNKQEEYGRFLQLPSGCNHNKCYYYLMQYQTVAFFHNASSVRTSAQLSDQWVNDIWNSKATPASKTLTAEKKQSTLQLLLQIDEHNPNAALYVDQLHEFFNFDDNSEGWRQKQANLFHTVSRVELWHGTLDSVAALLTSHDTNAESEGGLLGPLVYHAAWLWGLGMILVVVVTCYYYCPCWKSGRDGDKTTNTTTTDQSSNDDNGDGENTTNDRTGAANPTLTVVPSWAMPQDTFYMEAMGGGGGGATNDDEDPEDAAEKEQFEDELNFPQEEQERIRGDEPHESEEPMSPSNDEDDEAARQVV